MEGGHELVGGVERERGQPRQAFSGGVDVDPGLVPENQQRPLGGIADTCSAGISDSTLSRLTRAVFFIIDLSAFIALSAFPSWRRPTTALSSVTMTRSTAVLHSLMASDTIAAPTRMSCM